MAGLTRRRPALHYLPQRLANMTLTRMPSHTHLCYLGRRADPIHTEGEVRAGPPTTVPCCLSGRPCTPPVALNQGWYVNVSKCGTKWAIRPEPFAWLKRTWTCGQQELWNVLASVRNGEGEALACRRAGLTSWQRGSETYAMRTARPAARPAFQRRCSQQQANITTAAVQLGCVPLQAGGNRTGKRWGESKEGKMVCCEAVSVIVGGRWRGARRALSTTSFTGT